MDFFRTYMHPHFIFQGFGGAIDQALDVEFRVSRVMDEMIRGEVGMENPADEQESEEEKNRDRKEQPRSSLPRGQTNHQAHSRAQDPNQGPGRREIKVAPPDNSSHVRNKDKREGAFHGSLLLTKWPGLKTSFSWAAANPIFLDFPLQFVYHPFEIAVFLISLTRGIAKGVHAGV
jgi:hypothetical protein